MRACRERGIAPIAVYSSIDRGALHVREADEAIEIGGPAPAESYLRVDAILDAAARTRADAIHPGYGFLSENAAFAAACRDAGVIFVGPPPEAITAMGSKLGARERMERAGVPVVPGATPADQSDAGIRAAALAIGLPVVVKASAGGGGKGMRVVTEIDALDESIAAARREATRAFGDGTLYVERRVERPRHVEIQIFADAHGGCVHLFERECSIQRRHQKIVEETPSPALTPAVRARMGEAAVAAARAAGYVNAGTIEFLLEGTGDEARFYFLEMNTRLQVEHAITEAITGVDLVHAQLAVAAGAPLPWTQDALAPRGHAIEVRLCAEDPEQGFLPQAGRLLACRFPQAPGLRIDAGVERGDAIPVQYRLARRQARGARGDPGRGDRAPVRGAAPHPRLRRPHQRHAAGADPRPPALRRRRRRHRLRRRRARDAARRQPGVRRPRRRRVGKESSRCSRCCSRWSVRSAEKRRRFCDRGEPVDGAARVARMSGRPGTVAVTLDDGRVETWTVARADRTADGTWRLALVDPAGDAHAVEAIADGGDVWTAIDGVVRVLAAPAGPRRRGRAAAAHGLEAPMPATVTRIVASVGQRVAAGDVLVLLEAMKMELAIRAPHDGTVARIACEAGAIVQPGVPLVELS